MKKIPNLETNLLLVEAAGVAFLYNRSFIIMAKTTSLVGGKKSGSSSLWPIALIIVAIAAFVIFNQNNSNSTTEGEKDTDGTSLVDEYDYDGVCFVVGNTANSPEPDLTSSRGVNIAKITESVLNATEPGNLPQICMYSATSNPKEIEIKGLTEKFDNDYALANQKEEIVAAVNVAAASSPTEGGADYYQAILEAAGTLQGVRNPLIVVYGSGLSDHGILNFADYNLLDKNAKYATTILSQTEIRKNEYKNTDLIWLGVGKTVDDFGQKPLDENNQTKVQNIYDKALGYIGIKPQFNKITITADTTSVSRNYIVNPTFIPGQLKPGYKKSLDEKVAKFQPNTDILVNPAEVKAKLEDLAKDFNQTNNLRLKVTGYHAKCTGGSDQALSKKRATAISNILINELNVDASRIIAEGVGGPQDNRDEGSCDSEIASEHRAVIVEVVE